MRIGIDLGGTKIEGIALDGSEVLLRRRVPSPRDDYEATIVAIRDFVRAIRRETGRSGSVGVGIPGAMSTIGDVVKNANSTWMIGKPLVRDLEQALGQAVRVANDANCFALSEAADGAARHARSVFGVIIGTGTGAGIVMEGRIIEGRHRIAGEWGHNPLPWPRPDEWPGPPCYCGSHGCIETFLSGTGLVQTYESLNGTTPLRSAADVAASAESGNPYAVRALELYEGRLARSLASIINVLDPDIIVLGGGLSNIGRLYKNVPALWNRFVFSDTASTPLVEAMHGDSSGVRGAAWLWNEGESK